MKPEQFPLDKIGHGLLWVVLLAAFVAIIGYVVRLFKPASKAALWTGRLAFSVSGLSMLAAFGYLLYIVYTKQYQYQYVFGHTGSEITSWMFRFSAAWSGQEGSFALWAAMQAFIGFLVLARAGRYEARVMPFYISIIAFLAAILLKQSPFHLIPAPTAAEMAANPGWRFPPVEGQGLTPSLQNYWMAIHPPTIFFGFASLAVPYVYAIAALIWKDYDKWVGRVMPYALLSTATLGGGLFMGGYWAYETQGWHGFWAWDPVENASFFPWLAITALAHSLVVQRNKGGMARTNTFLGLLAFWLFIVGTFLTRSGALAKEDANGVLLSVHAFANLESSALIFLYVMLGLYGIGALVLWLARLRSMPAAPPKANTALSRDFAMRVSVVLMVVTCFVVAFGTNLPLLEGLLHRPPRALESAIYNKFLAPLALIAALFMGLAPWVAWKKTNSETFLRKMLLPWMLMLVFGFIMVFWAQGAQRAIEASFDPRDVGDLQTKAAWMSPTIQRLTVVLLTSVGFFAALSNVMLAYRVCRSKPLNAGGWIAHVGMGLLILGTIFTNTFERSERVVIAEGEAAKEVFAHDGNPGYKFEFVRMTGIPVAGRPMNPDFDLKNEVQLKVTPPSGDSFTVSPRWFVHNLNRAPSEAKLERMRWPHIQKYMGHDLYVGLASDPGFAWPTDAQPGVPDEQKQPGIRFQYKEKKKLGGYMVGYFDQYGEPGKLMGVHLVMANEDGKIIEAFPALRIERNPSPAEGEPPMTLTPVKTEVSDLLPDILQMEKLSTAVRDEVVKLLGVDKISELDGKKVVNLDKLTPEAKKSLLESLKGKNIPEDAFDKDRSKPAVIQVVRIDAGTKEATLQINLPDYTDAAGNKQPGYGGRWEIPLEVTYKPGVNIVWIGVIIAVLGTLLAMLRRAYESRKMKDDDTPPPPPVFETWEMPESDIPVPLAPAAPIVDKPKKGRLKPQAGN